MTCTDEWLAYAQRGLSQGEWLVTGEHAQNVRRLVQGEINRRAYRSSKDESPVRIEPTYMLTLESDPILFLDIDGVLNGHDYDPRAKSNGIDKQCVARLNMILDNTNARIVLSSAWRYMVTGGAVSLTGFEYLLRTHGVYCEDRIVGYTRKDAQLEDPNERVLEIMEWLEEHPRVTTYAVVDDLPLVFPPEGGEFPFVRTDGERGLTDDDAHRLIEHLRKRRAS